MQGAPKPIVREAFEKAIGTKEEEHKGQTVVEDASRQIDMNKLNSSSVDAPRDEPFYSISKVPQGNTAHSPTKVSNFDTSSSAPSRTSHAETNFAVYSISEAPWMNTSHYTLNGLVSSLIDTPQIDRDRPVPSDASHVYMNGSVPCSIKASVMVWIQPSPQGLPRPHFPPPI